MEYRKLDINWAIVFIMAGPMRAVSERLISLQSQYIGMYEACSMIFLMPAIVLFILALLNTFCNFNGVILAHYVKGIVSEILISLHNYPRGNLYWNLEVEVAKPTIVLHFAVRRKTNPKKTLDIDAGAGSIMQQAA